MRIWTVRPCRLVTVAPVFVVGNGRSRYLQQLLQSLLCLCIVLSIVAIFIHFSLMPLHHKTIKTEGKITKPRVFLKTPRDPEKHVLKSCTCEVRPGKKWDKIKAT